MQSVIRKGLQFLFGAMAALPLAAMAADPPYPSKPIRVVIGFPPGGAADVLGRILAKKLAETDNYQIIIENRAGAGSIIATEAVAHAPPDGYTLLLTASTIANNVGLKKKLPYDPIKDLAPIILIASAPNVVVAYPGLPANTIPELIKLAREKPGQLNYASGGLGTLGNLAGENLNMLAHIKLTHVPYTGASPALNDVAAGHVQLLITTLPAALPLIKSHTVKALAVTTPKRSTTSPEIPTVAESGVPGFDATNWYGFMAPAGTPPAIIGKINHDVAAALRSPDVVTAFAQQGADTMNSTPEQFAQYLKEEIDKWTKVIKAANIRDE